jgi:hypothetical protein
MTIEEMEVIAGPHLETECICINRCIYIYIERISKYFGSKEEDKGCQDHQGHKVYTG